MLVSINQITPFFYHRSFYIWQYFYFYMSYFPDIKKYIWKRKKQFCWLTDPIIVGKLAETLHFFLINVYFKILNTHCFTYRVYNDKISDCFTMSACKKRLQYFFKDLILVTLSNSRILLFIVLNTCLITKAHLVLINSVKIFRCEKLFNQRLTPW